MASYVLFGATGQVGLPVATKLAATGHEVTAGARFSSPEAKDVLEAAGVRCVVADLERGDGLDALPDADFVVNFAVAKSRRNFDADIARNAEAVGLVMRRFAGARAFLHCSSTAVYAPKPGTPVVESDPLGENNHRNLMPTYVLSKVAAEAVARTCARLYDLPTIVARLGVPYGDNGGWPMWQLLMAQNGIEVPVGPGGGRYNPIHEDDIARTVPLLLEHASVPATIVNWAGSETVSIAEWCAEMSRLTGLDIPVRDDDTAIESVVADITALRGLIGEPTTVPWKDGIRRLVASKFPDLLRA